MLTWVGILLCLSQSAMFSGLNLAVFSVSRMRLEVAAAGGNADASAVLALRRRSNEVLTTILWGNVSINVLLALLSDSVMTGVAAFFFSTVVITFFGEILPQAWFSRNAIVMAARLAPVLRFYMAVLYPFAKPSSLVLDAWLGPEGMQYYRERDFREVIRRHIDSGQAEIGRLEGLGALNFLAIDDRPLAEVGSTVAPASVVSLPIEDGLPVFPEVTAAPDDPFLGALHAADRPWIVITGEAGEPRFVLDADAFLRGALFSQGAVRPEPFLYRPTVFPDAGTELGRALPGLLAEPVLPDSNPRRRRVILVWGAEPRIVTSDDILDELLHGLLPGPDDAPGAPVAA